MWPRSAAERAHERAGRYGRFGLGGAESYPGVFGAFGGFADDAGVEAVNPRDDFWGIRFPPPSAVKP